MTTDDDPGRLRSIALGETGFERAAVWCAVGFAVSYVAFDAVALAGGLAGVTPPAPGVAAVLAALSAGGVTAFAVFAGGGVLPAMLLAFGPFMAILLRTVGPQPYTVPLADPLPFLRALVGPFGLAVAAALAVGAVGYAVGRGIARVDADEPGDAERDSAASDERADASG